MRLSCSDSWKCILTDITCHPDGPVDRSHAIWTRPNQINPSTGRRQARPWQGLGGSRCLPMGYCALTYFWWLGSYKILWFSSLLNQATTCTASSLASDHYMWLSKCDRENDDDDDKNNNIYSVHKRQGLCWAFINIISFNAYNSSIREGLLLFSFYVRKLRFREAKWLLQDHLARKSQGWVSNQFCLSFEPIFVNSVMLN